MVIPGGAIPFPRPPRVGGVGLDYVAIRPRKSFYLEGEVAGSMIVDVKVGLFEFPLLLRCLCPPRKDQIHRGCGI